MTYLAKIFGVLCLIATPAYADAVFDYNANGLEARNLIDRTNIGVTRDKSQLWVLTIWSNNKYAISYENNTTGGGTWRKPSNSVFCFMGMNPAEPDAEVCKLMRPNGRGTDYRDIVDVVQNEDGGTSFTYKFNEHRGVSQIVYSFPGGNLADDFELRPTIYGYKGRTIIGRTLKDRETWLARFDWNGRVDFAYGSGRRYQGNYEIRGESMCIKFPDKPELGGCRQPISKSGKVLWTNPENGSAISEVLFAMANETVPLANENNLWELLYQQNPQSIATSQPKGLPVFTEEDAEELWKGIMEEEKAEEKPAKVSSRAQVRRAIDDILSAYSFGTGTYELGIQSGETIKFQADTRLSIRMVKPDGDYLEELCGIVIENAFVPHGRTVSANGKTYSLPEPSKNRFELTLGLQTAMTYMEAVGPPLNLIENGKSGLIPDLHAYGIAWNNGVILLENSGVYGADTAKLTTLQMPKSADRKEFWEKIMALHKVCAGF